MWTVWTEDFRGGTVLRVTRSRTRLWSVWTEGSVDEGHRKREDAQLQRTEVIICLRRRPSSSDDGRMGTEKKQRTVTTKREWPATWKLTAMRFKEWQSDVMWVSKTQKVNSLGEAWQDTWGPGPPPSWHPVTEMGSTSTWETGKGRGFCQAEGAVSQVGISQGVGTAPCPGVYNERMWYAWRGRITGTSKQGLGQTGTQGWLSTK